MKRILMLLGVVYLLLLGYVPLPITHFFDFVREIPARAYAANEPINIDISKGKLEWPNGASYEGMQRNGEPHGYGKLAWPNGSSYEGMFQYGKQHGHGILRWDDRVSYVGEWRNNKYNGFGERQMTKSFTPNAIKNYRKEGQGKWEGNKYIVRGVWENGTLAFESSHGITHRRIAGRYVGETLKGKAHGKGKAQGRDSYEGMFQYGRMHGYGTYTWGDGSGSWIGEYRDNERYGFGKRVYERGNKRIKGYPKGIWEGDVFIIQQGLWKKGGFMIAATSREDGLKRMQVAENKKVQASATKKAKNKRAQAASKRTLQARLNKGCDNYYPGYVGKLKLDRILATEDEFIVRYVNKNQDSVTLEGIRGGNSLRRGRIIELSCPRLIRAEVR